MLRKLCINSNGRAEPEESAQQQDQLLSTPVRLVAASDGT